jgi:hypothetical protein
LAIRLTIAARTSFNIREMVGCLFRACWCGTEFEDVELVVVADLLYRLL